jgi:hypothetical protein
MDPLEKTRFIEHHKVASTGRIRIDALPPRCVTISLL